MPSKRSSQSVRGPRRLRSVRKAGELRSRPQRRLHQLVAIGRPANHPDGEERSDNALHLSGVPRHRRRRASGRGRPVAITRRAILERLVLERNWLAEILAKRGTRADPCPIQGGASRPAAAAGTDLLGAVKFIQQAREWPKKYGELSDGGLGHEVDHPRCGRRVRPLADCDFNLAALHPAYPIKCRTSLRRAL
jgi:hypothetical protein